MFNRCFRKWMVTKQGDLYADRPTKDIELLVCAGGRGGVPRSVLRPLRHSLFRLERLFWRTLAETEAGVRRTIVETQRTLGETDAQ
jgi:hypothetical protein